MDDRQKIIVICGPTAGGKTDLSIKLAQKFSGQIISADSMQIYKKLDIGTAKATAEEQKRAKHHLIDILTPDMPYSVQNFVEMAGEKIDLISRQKDIPIVVGGTGLYIESLIKGVKFARQPDNSRIKARLQQELLEYGKDYMYNILKETDPRYALSVHPNNTVRVLRAIEVYRLTGKNMTEHLKESLPQNKPYNALVLGLTYTDRQTLYNKINLRVDLMMESGLLSEAEYVYQNRQSFKTCTAAIGYKEFFPYFDGEASLAECVDKLKQASRNYAKRQLTWFNRMQEVQWLYRDSDDFLDKAYNLTYNFLQD